MFRTFTEWTSWCVRRLTDLTLLHGGSQEFSVQCCELLDLSLSYLEAINRTIH